MWAGVRYANAEMAMIWYEKKEFVNKAIKMDPFGSDMYIWLDVGALRGRDNVAFNKTYFGQMRDFRYEKGKIFV